MDGPASRHTQDQPFLQSIQDSDPSNTDLFGAGSTTASSDASSALQGSIPHLGLNSAAVKNTSLSPVNPSLPDQSTAQNVGAQLSPSAEAHAGETTNAGQQPADVMGPVDHSPIKVEGGVYMEHVNAHVELLEGSESDTSIVSGDGTLIVQESQEWIPEPDQELKRVKVYKLIGQRWVDQGTAFCFGQLSEERNEALLIARSERDYEEIILTTAIRSNDAYQRQQDTLIVWTELDGIDYALSFQDPEGCAQVWNFILEVQQHLNVSDDQPNISSSPLLGPETSVTTTSIIRSGHLPAPQLGIISEIERAIKQLARTQVVKERICEYIQHEEYIKSLIEVMHTAEDLESLENLHALCSLMQTILMLNDHTMYEHILEDDIFFGVVGMLEYDPDFPGHKANYRDFLHNTAQFHQPIPMRDIAIQRKIHHTYRLQFLKDVVLARALDDSTFNVLNSCIIFNQIDIITHVQQDPNFLRDIVKLFVDEDMLTGGNGKKVNPPDQPIQQAPNLQHMVISLNGNGDNTKVESPRPDFDREKALVAGSNVPNGMPTVTVNGNNRVMKSRAGYYAFSPPDDLSEEEITLRREVVLLLQQLSTMGKNVQMPARLTLFRTLVDRGILFAIQWALALPEKEEANKQMISAAGEVLAAMLDHDLNGVRGHVLKQVFAIEKEREAGKKGADKAETLLEMACRIMVQSKDLSVQSQMGDALKSWLEVPTGDPLITPTGAEAVGKAPPRKDEPGTERFLEYFYKVCADILLKPLMEIPEWKMFKGALYPLTREETNRSVYLCDLLYNCIQQHQFRSYLHVMSSDILSRIATLLRAKDKHLRHAAFRIFRLLLKLKNANAHVHILKHDILKPILDLTVRESLRENLLSCSCQEFFDIIRRENMKELIKFCVVKHEAELQDLARSPLNGELFQRFIQKHEMNTAPRPEEPPKEPEDGRHQEQERALDREEEDYFNADEDAEFVPPISHQTWSRNPSVISPLLANNTGMKRKRRPAVGAATKGYRPPLKTPQLTSLVDYGDDEDEEPATTEVAQSKSIAPPTANLNSPDLPISIPPISEPPPKRPSKDDDDEDNLLEALARNNRSRPQSPLLKLPTAKRRREEDEDEELLVHRLSKPSKKPDLGNQKEISTLGRRKSSDDLHTSKKIRVKLGSVGLSVTSTQSNPATTAGNDPSVSQPGTKDGDTG